MDLLKKLESQFRCDAYETSVVIDGKETGGYIIGNDENFECEVFYQHFLSDDGVLYNLRYGKIDCPVEDVDYKHPLEAAAVRRVMYVFYKYSDGRGIGSYELFKTKNEALKVAEKERLYIDERDFKAQNDFYVGKILAEWVDEQWDLPGGYSFLCDPLEIIKDYKK